MTTDDATPYGGTPLTSSRLASMLSDPQSLASLSPLGEHKLILLDTHPDSDDESALTACRHGLPHLTCPVIGIGLDGALAPLTDTNVTHPADARSMIANILKHPVAAMTLVQLLRHNEHATVEQGLLAESLAYSTLQGGTEFRTWLSQHAQAEQSTAPDDPVLLERRGDTLLLTLNRPAVRNAFSHAMRDQLAEGLHLLALDPTLAKAVIQGAGACFCVGGDLSEFGSYPDTATAHAICSVRHVGRQLHQQRERVECHLHRACIGAGVELPAFASRVVASQDAYFQLPELRLGLVSGAGGTVSIPRRIGRQHTAWLALSGRRIGATEALAWGLIDATAAPAAGRREVV